MVADLPDAITELLVRVSDVAQFAPGDLLLEQGGEASKFYVIRAGRVSIELHTERSSRVLQTVGPGGIVGWSWLFKPFRWHFAARAAERTRALRVDAERIRSACDEDPRVGYELYSRFSLLLFERLRATREQLLEHR